MCKQTSDDLCQSGFLRLPLWSLQVKGLSPAAKLFYAALLYYDWQGKGFPGYEEAARLLDIGARTCADACGELRKRRLIDTHREYGKPLKIVLLAPE